MKRFRLLLEIFRLVRNSFKADSLTVEKRRIVDYPRYTVGTFSIFGKTLKFADSASCHFIFEEIFEKEIYKFKTTDQEPYIIDAGANIGLSVIYFKMIYPGAAICAFEPDENICAILNENITTFGFTNITVINKALWNSETTLEFISEGADAGRIGNEHNKSNRKTIVSTERLRNYIKKKVDFLKIDIEGAETTVLSDCADLLGNVDRIFVEYHSFVGQHQTCPELLSMLRNAGFRLNISSPGLHSKSPFMNVQTYNGMDMQLNIYGWRA